ncbi:MAG: hypothetical protein GY729_11720 [Desulfobacteraceae bacterium]|nr:hypothetical protein [Desulfobacteraceae bacterium]
MGADSICFVADNIGDYKYMRGGCGGGVDFRHSIHFMRLLDLKLTEVIAVQRYQNR